jgi:hypothetical protein
MPSVVTPSTSNENASLQIPLSHPRDALNLFPPCDICVTLRQMPYPPFDIDTTTLEPQPCVELRTGRTRRTPGQPTEEVQGDGTPQLSPARRALTCAAELTEFEELEQVPDRVRQLLRR